MKTPQLVHFVVAAVLCWSAPLFAAIRLVPTVPSGLSAPVFVGHAGDGSNRLFIVEQGGVIKVVQPGSSTPTTFLDIRTKVLSGGERGLLGLAFHPQYASNGRFFVFYTRSGDGALVIAEYHVSANPDVASSTETILLTIPHPTNANHNGGMLAFGTDGYLYIGVGDGGSAKRSAEQRAEHGRAARQDPAHRRRPARSGRRHSLFVAARQPVRRTRPAATKSSRSVCAIPGDSASTVSPDSSGSATWARARAKKSTRRSSTAATTAGASSKGPPARTTIPRCAPRRTMSSPLFDYSHVNGRCSITGGYVYRGSQRALASGTYVFGDYCSGEIFAWNGSADSPARHRDEHLFVWRGRAGRALCCRSQWVD